MEAALERFLTTDQGTLGRLDFSGAVFCTLEPPWRENRRSVSCIPDGSYTARPYQSPKFGGCYQIVNVPGRDFILFHAGNLAGDTAKGLASDTSGCVLLGETFGALLGQMAILQSRAALKRFLKAAGGREINLKIESAWLAAAQIKGI